MTAYQDANDGGKWKIYATHRGKIRAPADPSTPGFGSGSDLTNLISIDPATGIGTRLHPIIDAPATAYQGLALGPRYDRPIENAPLRGHQHPQEHAADDRPRHGR